MSGLLASADFDLGEFLAIGLDTSQIAHLAGSLFLGLFALSAVRRASAASGFLPAVWIAIGIALLAGGLAVAAHGFPDLIPDWLKPWTDPDRLTRAAAVAILLGCSLVMLSAHWVRGPNRRLLVRLAGLALAGLAVWLAGGWFADQVPDEAREWTGRTVLVRAVVILGLVALAAAFWFRGAPGRPHSQWLNRTLSPAALATAVILAARWFGPLIPVDLPLSDVIRVAAVVGGLATGTCLLIAGGAYLMRERPPTPRPRPKVATAARREPVSDAPILPVAVLLDEHGRPILPVAANPNRPHAGPPGA
ncbi:MAG TPA: hypothetical protein VKE40_22705 [Gemmataceae bacterium]|nr:hypothetical protein [Gemmataceae bacterium]